MLALLDTTGTLTQKHQARLIPGQEKTELISDKDIDLLYPFVNPDIDLSAIASPINHPLENQLLPICEIFARLKTLVGEQFANIGYDQEWVVVYLRVI